MSWEPDTEEIRLGKVRKELDDLKASTSFLNTSINEGMSSNALGSGFGVSSFNQGSNGDIPQQIENVLEDISGTFWGIVDVIGSLLVINPASANEQVANQSTIRKLNGGVDGQKTVIKPAKGKTVKLINNPNTNSSTDGNLLLGADLVLTDTESVTLRFTTDILYKDSYESGDPTKAEIQKIGGWIIESTGSGSGNSTSGVLKDPVKVATTGNNSLHPAWGSTIDGIGMVAGDRFLVKDQTTQADNGIYIWGTGTLGVSVRASDMSHGSVQKEGTMTYVQDGLTQNEILYAINIGGNNILIGTNPNTWGEIGSGSGGGSGSIKSPVKVATTADVTSWTYNNTSGTLTASGNGVVIIDGITLAVNNRILVKNQSPANENGIYSVTTAGAVGATLVLTRSTDMSTGSTIEGGTMVYVTDGTVNGDNLFGLTTEGTVTVGTGNQVWANLTADGANTALSNLGTTSINSDLTMQNGLSIANLERVAFNTRTSSGVNGSISYDGTNIFAKGSGAEVNLTSTTNNWSDITIDVDKDMNNKQLTNLNAVVSTSNITATGFIFNTSSGNPSKITSSATSDIMGFMVNGVEKGSFAKDGALDTIFEVAGNPNPMMKFSSTATGTNRVVGTIQFDGLDLAPSRQTYGLIYGWSRNVGASSKEGELQFNVMKSNVSTGIMKMDGTGLLPYADNASALGSASLGWSEIRSKGSVYGSQYYFVTSSGTAPRITSSANSTVMGLWVDGFESASVTYDTFGGNKDGEIAINGSSAIGARFKMYNSATPSGGSTTAGRMYFDAIKDGGGGGSETFAMIEAGATNYNSGSEQGEIDFQVRRGGSNTESVAIINQTGFHPPINNSQNYNLGSASTPWNVVYAETFHAITTDTPALIELYRDNTVLGDNEMGRIIWYGDRTGVNKDPLAWIRTNILDYTQGDAYMGLDIAVNGSQDTFIELYGDDPKIRLHKPADLVRQAVPTDPLSNATGKLFYNSVDNHLSFRKKNDANNAFETVDLEGGGASGANLTLSNVTSVSISLPWADGVRQTFNPNPTNSGLNVGADSNGPSSPVNGDIYYNSSSDKFRVRENGAWENMLGGSWVGTAGSDLDMNAWNIKSTTSPTLSNHFKVIFDGHDNSNTYISNTDTTVDRINVFSGGNNVAIIQPTVIQFNQDLNMGTSDVANIDRLIFNQATGTVLGSTSTGITSNAGGNMIFNIDTSDKYLFQFGGSLASTTIDNSTGVTTPNVLVSNTVVINSSSSVPVANGMIATNSSGDVRVYSGGSIRNMSDIGSGAGGGVNSSYIWTNDETNEYDQKVYLSNATMGSSGGLNGVNARLIKDNIYYIPIYFSKACTIDEIGYECTISGGSSVTLRYGLYSNRTDNQNYPHQLLDGGGSSDVVYLGASTGASRYPMSFTRTISVPSAGLFWIAINNTNNTSTTFRIEGGDVGGVNTVGHVYNSSTNPDKFEPIQAYKESDSGSMPSTADDDNQSIGFGDTGNRAPVIFLRLS